MDRHSGTCLSDPALFTDKQTSELADRHAFHDSGSSQVLSTDRQRERDRQTNRYTRHQDTCEHTCERERGTYRHTDTRTLPDREAFPVPAFGQVFLTDRQTDRQTDIAALTDRHAFPDPGSGQVAGGRFLLLRRVAVVQHLAQGLLLLVFFLLTARQLLRLKNGNDVTSCSQMT